MRKLQLLSIAFAVVVAGTLVGVSEVSAQGNDGCNASCAEDCKGLKGADQKACKLKCLGGRCGNPGAITVAEVTGEPGIDCSEDGECNAFCDAEPDPDCCAPSTTPLQASGIPDASGSISVLPPIGSGWDMEFWGEGEPGDCEIAGLGVFFGGTKYRKIVHICPDGQVRMDLVGYEWNPTTAAGDFVNMSHNLQGGQVFRTTVFLPELTGALPLVTLYPADDGSTYYDAALTQLAASACDFNECAALTKVVVFPLVAPVGTDISVSAEASDQEGDPISFRWAATAGSFVDPTASATDYTCSEAGDPEISIEVSDDEFGSCVDSWTVTVTCTTSTCEELCEAQAEQLYDQCLAEGGTEVGCRALALDHFEACVAENCEPPGTCVERCEKRAEEWYDRCVAEGGTVDECNALARAELEQCVADNCEPP